MGTIASGPGSIGGIEFDSVYTQEEVLAADVPEYPVEDGFTTSDNVSIKATVLTVVAIIANNPITWASRHGSSSNRVGEIKRQLKKLFTTKRPVTYVSNGETWENMVVQGLKFPDDKESGDSIKATLTLKQITITEKQTALVTISFPRGGTSSTNAGSVSSKKSGTTGKSKSASSSKKSASTSSSKKNGSSIAYGTFSKLGLFSK